MPPIHSRMYGMTVALILMAFSPAANAAEERADFTVSVAGVRAGTLSMAANRDGNQYAVRAEVKEGGVVGAIFNFYYGGVARGSVTADGAVVPSSYEGVRQIRDDKRKTLISFTAGRPASVTQDPARRSRKWDIDPASQGGTLDPVSATYSLLRDAPRDQACDRTIEVFDGSRRSRLIIQPGQSTGNQEWTCRGVYRRVAGYSPKDMKEKTDFPFTLFYADRGDMMRLTRFQTQSILGLAVAQRR